MVELIAQEPAPPTPPQPAFEEYPKVMRHPGEKKSVPVLVPGTARLDALGNPIEGTGQYIGTVAQFPPVHVHNRDQEDYHYAQGYRSAGTMDAAAFDRIAAAPIAPPHEVQRYPMWCSGKLVNNAEEEAAVSRSATTLGEAEGETTAPLDASGVEPKEAKPALTPAQARMAKARAARKRKLIVQ